MIWPISDGRSLADVNCRLPSSQRGVLTFEIAEILHSAPPKKSSGTDKMPYFLLPPCCCFSLSSSIICLLAPIFRWFGSDRWSRPFPSLAKSPLCLPIGDPSRISAVFPRYLSVLFLAGCCITSMAWAFSKSFWLFARSFLGP